MVGVAITPPIQDAFDASIAAFGVVIPVLVDQYDRVIDGERRAEAAKRFGLDYPIERRTVVSDEQREILRAKGNANRRPLDAAMRQKMVRALRAEGHSTRAIAIALRIGLGTVGVDLRDYDGPETITGIDGMTYAARRPHKVCSMCKVSKPTTAFTRDATSADGRGGECRVCQIQRHRQRVRTPRNPAKTRAAIDARHARIRELVEEGWLVQNIANDVGMSVEHLRRTAKTMGLDLRADRLAAGTHASDWNRVMDKFALDVEVITSGLDALNTETLDGTKLTGWIETIGSGIRDLQSVHRKLRDERSRRQA